MHHGFLGLPGVFQRALVLTCATFESTYVFIRGRVRNAVISVSPQWKIYSLMLCFTCCFVTCRRIATFDGIGYDAPDVVLISFRCRGDNLKNWHVGSQVVCTGVIAAQSWWRVTAETVDIVRSAFPNFAVRRDHQLTFALVYRRAATTAAQINRIRMRLVPQHHRRRLQHITYEEASLYLCLFRCTSSRLH